MHICQVAYQYGRTVDVFHYDVPQFLQVVDEADTPYHICLRAFRDNVAAHVDITVGNGVVQFQRGDAIIDQLVRVDTNLKSLHLSAEADNIRYARYCTEVTFDHPVLNGFQFAHAPFVTAQGVAEYLSRRTIEGLYLRCDPFRQVGVVQQVVYLLAGGEVVHLIFKHHIDHR